MAKVSLRIYHREIESLIDQGGTNEAIAHCRHILQTFPKSLETYRLLGKASLESHRYDEAVDVLSRVLMSVPDDFVSHVGMSIISDEENRLDDAIWHMERAFESQPSNPAIQGELQRLYGRRDGMEPPKVRMTRGALAHMYVQGELYPQAIAEIRAVLAQDPQRADMQVLLARAYFKSGQKADASETCNQLFKNYPYCFEANRIMVELVPSKPGAVDDAQVYRIRVNELDPYAGYTRGSVYLSNDVPDNAVNLERLEYSGEEVPMGREWSSSKAIGASTTSEQPDWLKGFSSPEPGVTSQEVFTPAFQAQDEIPEFLRQAGWGESSGAPEQPVSILESPDAAGSDLAPADITGWLKGQTPSEPAGSIDAPASALSSETPDWLSGLGGRQFSEPATAEQSAESPDWLSGLGGSQLEESVPAQSAEMPNWLGDLGGADLPTPEPIKPKETRDWLGRLRSEKFSEPEPAGSTDTPDWLNGLGAQSDQPAASIEDLGASAEEQDDAVAWLESLAAKNGAKPEELVTDPNKRSETPPEWVEQAQAVSQSDFAKAVPMNIDSLGASAEEQDDAVAWLESLAAKHGAKPEELVTDPAKRSETPPDWVQQVRSAADLQPTETGNNDGDWSTTAQNIGEQFFADFEDAAAPKSDDETGMWLKDQAEKEKHRQASDKVTSDLSEWMDSSKGAEQEASPASDLPGWMAGNRDEPAVEGFGSNLQTGSRGDLSDWLNHLDEEPAVMPANPAARRDLPDWLSGVDAQDEPSEAAWKKPVEETPASSPTESPAPVSMGLDLPGWLQGVDEDSKTTVHGDEAEAPWLREKLSEPEEESQLKPTSPSDWHPVESKLESPRKADFASRPPRPKPKPSAVQSQEPVYTPIDGDWPSSEPSIETRPPSIVGSTITRQPPIPEATQPSAVQMQRPPQKPAGLKKSAARSSETQPGSSGLIQAKGELDRGDIPAALEHYGKLIKKGRHLEETIRDLSDSIYRYPVEVSIWQTLGDAYMRANRLKEALEAYNKAEELIR